MDNRIVRILPACPMRSCCLFPALLAAALAGPAAGPAAAQDFDAAASLVLTHAPTYLGAQRQSLGWRPGVYLSWGRFTLSSGASFAADREADDVRGMGVELLRNEALRVRLGLRFDSGRRESADPALAGMGVVKHTIRARLAASWAAPKPWRLDTSWTVDAFGRGGGNLGEATLAHDRELGADTTLTLGGTVTLAGDRYLQTWFGVTPEQSARTGYPVHEPGLGLRDVQAFVSLHRPLSGHWVLMSRFGFMRLLGAAADSPLVRRVTTHSVTLGLGYRF